MQDTPESHIIASKTDTYFTRGYGVAAAHSVGGRFENYTSRDGNVHMPLILRPTRFGFLDAQSPYGYAGARFLADASAESIHRLWNNIANDLKERGIVSIFLRQSALVEAPAPPDEVMHTTEGHVTYLVLNSGETQIWEGMAGRTRTSIRKAQKNGLSANLRVATAEDLHPSSPFREIYADTMSRLSARDFYSFDDEYYRLLLQGLGRELLICTATNEHGATVGAALFMKGPEYLHYHLSGASDEGRAKGATPLLLWEAIREMGNDPELLGLHLGGGVPVGGGLDKFKKGFGGEVLPYISYGWIVDETRYQSAASAHLGEGASNEDNFFPAYRR